MRPSSKEALHIFPPSTVLCQAERMLQSYPRSFRPSGGWSAILTICSLLCTVGGAVGTWYFGTGHEAGDPQGRFLLTGLSILFFLAWVSICCSHCGDPKS